MSRATWAQALIGCSLIAALAAFASSARPAGAQAPAARLLVVVPGPVLVVAGTATGLAVLLLFVFVFAQGRRRRAPDEDDPETRDSARLRRAMRPIAALLTLIVVVQMLWRNPELVEFVARIPYLMGMPGPQAADADVPAASVPLFTAAVTVLALCIGLGSLAVVLWLIFGERLAQWWSRERDVEPEELVAAVDDSLDDLRLEPDPRAAIIKCYARFERVLERSLVPRAPWQTPLEFMERALSRLPLPPAAVRELTHLFELSRFSNEPLGPPAREAAWDALVEIKTALAVEEIHVS